MFEELKLLGSTERRIVVQTRKGTSVENLVELEPGDPERRRYQLLLQRFGQNWKERKPACGTYNCAGHVWASRRTSVLKPDAWRIILEEDEYRLLLDAEIPIPGDLALYVNQELGEFLHVGMILDVQKGVTAESLKVAWVLSKWNSTSGEVMHFAHDVPYGKQGIPFNVEYWTDRPV